MLCGARFQELYGNLVDSQSLTTLHDKFDRSLLSFAEIFPVRLKRFRLAFAVLFSMFGFRRPQISAVLVEP